MDDNYEGKGYEGKDYEGYLLGCRSAGIEPGTWSPLCSPPTSDRQGRYDGHLCGTALENIMPP